MNFPTELWYLIVLAILVMLYYIVKFIIRKWGKKEGIPTQDLEDGLDLAKDKTIELINKEKEKNNGQLPNNNIKS